MTNNALRKRKTRLISAATILSLAALLSRIVGLVRERVFTTTFGAGDIFDAFVAAFRIPDLIFNIIVVGALSAAFIPLFTEKMIKGEAGEEKAHEFALAVMNLILLVMAGLSLVFILLASKIVPLITPGFDGEKLKLTVDLSRIMALQPILLGASFVISGVLNSYRRFLAYALAPIFYNLGIVFGVVVLVPRVGVAGLGWGVVLGGALHLIVQLPGAWDVGFRWRLAMPLLRDDLRKLWRLMLPRVVGLAAMQVNLLMVTFLGSTLLAGSIAVFHLANNVQYLPVGIFGIAFAQAAFPALSEQIARGRRRDFLATLTRTFRYIMYFVVPASVFFFLLRAQIIRVLFGAGAFDWEDTIMTFETFGWLIVSIFAQATVPLLVRAFYAQHNTIIPVVASMISVAVNVVLAVWLAPSMGVQGLALAFSAAAIINFVLLLGMLHWQCRGFRDREVIVSLIKVIIASLAAGLLLQILKNPVAQMVNMNRFWGVFTQMVVTGGAGGVAYLGITWLMRSEEVRVFWDMVVRRKRWVLAEGRKTTSLDAVGEEGAGND
jgi:putative peptidoglycan lipid II flippase